MKSVAAAGICWRDQIKGHHSKHNLFYFFSNREDREFLLRRRCTSVHCIAYTVLTIKMGDATFDWSNIFRTPWMYVFFWWLKSEIELYSNGRFFPKFQNSTWIINLTRPNWISIFRNDYCFIWHFRKPVSLQFLYPVSCLISTSTTTEWTRGGRLSAGNGNIFQYFFQVPTILSVLLSNEPIKRYFPNIIGPLKLWSSFCSWSRNLYKPDSSESGQTCQK